MVIQFIVLLLTGALGGALAGLIGIGGGLVYILALDFFLEKIGVPKTEIHQFTIANSILAVFFAALSASIKLKKAGEFYLKQVLYVSVGSIIASVLVLHFYVNTPLYSKTQFDYVIIIILSYMLFRVFKKVSSKGEDTPLESSPKRFFFVGGAGGGAIASLSGMGGGVIMIPVFHTMIGVNMKTARSISLGVIKVTSLVMSLINLFEKGQYQLTHQLQWGYIIPGITVPLVLGVLVGGPLGVGLSKKMSDKAVSTIYAVFLCVFILKKAAEIIQWL